MVTICAVAHAPIAPCGVLRGEQAEIVSSSTAATKGVSDRASTMSSSDCSMKATAEARSSGESLRPSRKRESFTL